MEAVILPNLFKGTQQECQDLINRLNSLYGFPNEHTYSFGVEEEYNSEEKKFKKNFDGFKFN